MAKHGQRPIDILQASVDLFYERGFAAVGMDAIGERAGVSGPAIYRHFGGKDEILVTLFDEAIDRLVEVTAGRFEDPREELSRLVHGHAEFVLSERRLAGVKIREERSLAEPFRQRLQRREARYLDRWEDVLTRCYPDARPVPLRAARDAAIGALNSIASWPPSVLRGAHVPDTLADVVLGILDVLDAAASPAAQRPR